MVSKDLRYTPRLLRQSHLGSSGQNELAILDLQKPISGRETSVQGENSCNYKLKKETFIFRLPDELLFKIIEDASVREKLCSIEGHCDCETKYNCMDMRILALVSHRFNRSVLPLLYHTIRFHRKSTVPPTLAIIRLYRSLQNNPSIRRYCRVLSISVNEIGCFKTQAEDNFRIAYDLASWLTNVRCLEIHGGFENRYNQCTWAFVRTAIRHMRELEHLSISRQCFGLLLAHIMVNVDVPSLKKLDIHGVSEAEGGNDLQLERKLYRNASFTSLCISDYNESPQATAQLLRWPIALSHFHFGSFYSNRSYMDLPLFRSMLWTHRDTLKTLSIGYLSRAGAGRLFNVSDFPNLESLTLSRWQMSPDLDSPVVDADMLLGPRLKTFGWDFSIYDQHSENWNDFGEKEENWVKELARAAAARKAALREIKIQFNPDYWNPRAEDGYPWDRMERIGDEMRPSGMLLKYSEPVLTKEAWLAMLSEERDVEMNSPSIEQNSSVPSSPEISSLDSNDADLEGLDLNILDLHGSESILQGRDIRLYLLPT